MYTELQALSEIALLLLKTSTICCWTSSYQSPPHYKFKKNLSYTIQVAMVIWIAIRLAPLIHIISKVHLVNYHIHICQPFCHFWIVFLFLLFIQYFFKWHASSYQMWSTSKGITNISLPLKTTGISFALFYIFFTLSNTVFYRK